VGSAFLAVLDEQVRRLMNHATQIQIPERERRLWPWLSHPVRRDPPPKGIDAAGERVRGAVARRSAGKNLRARAERVSQAAHDLRSHSDAAVRSLVEERRDRLCGSRRSPQTIDAAAETIVECIRRRLGLTLHVEQLMGGLAMAAGTAVEMATGEGKTVTGILPTALLAWSGRGVHVATVNDYLARRDAEITGPVYDMLGLDVGVIQDGSSESDRREAYARSITYVADKQLIFDFLRDRLKTPSDPRMVGHLLELIDGQDARLAAWSGAVVQRGHHACIVDEADSILIDEAITPAVIASETQDVRASRQAIYDTAASVSGSLQENEHYILDRRLKKVVIKPEGRELLERLSAELPEFWRGPRRREELVVQAISARELFRRDDDYVIVDGKVQIVDASTGRILPGRQWQLGLHQAVEAKEGLEVTEPRRTTSRVSYQGYFRRYGHLCGMSGTMWEVRHELWRAYHLPVVRIPTHSPIARRHLPDRVFTTESQKLAAVVDRVVELRERGQPVLVGTRAVATSERLASMLAERDVPCRVLNATREAEEASIVADAGVAAAVTVSTNMAGRGTDIGLDARARAAGGLAVIATERHDERRVDRQLFGRSGRQGDPGLAQAFVSLEDALVVRHGLGFLAGLVRVLPAGLWRPVAALLWWQAQTSAGSRATTLRAELTRSDANMEMSLKGQSR
jgi:preprotein translocase subunit SecA